ncbi:head GIN domain-containing protein [Aequorivita nionensis]|uniref:head GIN domain-containing protein n=1 Tax=Aequorivita nionensis TaxID=1287690 RepID=UPI003965D63F
MKKLIFIVMLCVSAISFSQQTTEVGDFSELKVYDLITVKLVPSDENKVVVEGENTEFVKTINDNGVLKIRMELEERFDGSATTVTVYFKNVSILDANEGAEINSEEEIKETSLELKTQEGGKINVAVAAENIDIKSVSGGVIKAKGTTKKQDISINSGGIYEAKDLISSEAFVNVTAGGSATIFTTEKVEAKVTAGGYITVYGNPKDVKKKKLAGGKIEIIEGKN